MASADDDFFPAVFDVSVGRERGFSEERISRAVEERKVALLRLEERLAGREHLAGGDCSLADVVYAGNFVCLRELAQKGAVALAHYPNFPAWMERIEARESYKDSA